MSGNILRVYSTGLQGATGATGPEGPSQYATVGVLTKLRQNLQDVTILFVGDSTGDGDGTTAISGDPAVDGVVEWIYGLTEWLADAYPAYTVKYYRWAAYGSSSYSAGTTIQTGTGSNTLHIYNMSVGGSSSQFVLSPYFTAKVVTPDPDLVVISHGLNEGAIISTASNVHNVESFRSRYMCLTESIREALPDAPILCIAESPIIHNTYQAERVLEIARVCEWRGYGFVNVHDAFLDYGDWEGDLIQADGTHPNQAGQDLWLATVLPHFTWRDNMQPRPALPSLFTDAPVVNLLTNADFADFTAPSAPTGWTGTNVTFAEDTTNYETGTHAVKLTVTGAAASTAAHMQQDVSNYAQYAGKVVTLLARVRNNRAAKAQFDGRISMSDGIKTVWSLVDERGFGNYLWRAVTMRVDAAPTRLRVRLYAQSDDDGAPSGTDSDGNADVSFDRVFLVPGPLPRPAVEF